MKSFITGQGIKRGNCKSLNSEMLLEYTDAEFNNAC
jgi:hypothetical protein